MVGSPLLSYMRVYSLHYTIIFLCGVFFLYSEYELVPRWQTITFQLNNPKINKKFVQKELISDVECVLMAVLISSGVIWWYCMIRSHAQSFKKMNGAWMNNRPEWLTKERHLFHVSMICLGLIFAINGALTNSLKLIIGNTRPDFLDRCQPDFGRMKENEPDAYYTVDICQQKDLILLYDGLKSTPSGHSSFITCGLGFIYYWQSKFIIGNSMRNVWCLFLIAIVMVSRVVDNKHYWYDVLSGTLLGVGIIISCWKWVFNQKRSSGSLLPSPISL